MSKLTTCNFCSLCFLKSWAEQQDKEITILRESGDNGNTVYIHPKNVNVHILEDSERATYWKAWMMKITDHCVC